MSDRLDRGELDVGVLQVFADERRADDVTLASDALHWVKSPDLAIDTGKPIPLLTFDQDCFYRDWALHAEPPPPSGFQIVMECASIAGIISAVGAGLGVTLLNARHLQPDMEIIANGFPTPPDIAYVVRTGRSADTSAVKALARTLTSDADWHRPPSPR
ncbi:LysR substrate-binding domain-containing protein [Jiella pacifica]|uniref:LysR substrate-binding domain-containing protein n=1 Tax=Jiella pacifica TaxID=2696469 RepID=UPI0028AA24BD|nr:LysR substrate-binding domain-containing protein [Jiella pacifica]